MIEYENSIDWLSVQKHIEKLWKILDLSQTEFYEGTDLFQWGCGMNHSCAPNCFWKYESQPNFRTIYARRKIKVIKGCIFFSKKRAKVHILPLLTYNSEILQDLDANRLHFSEID